MIQGFNTYVDEKIANIGAKSFTVYRFNFFTDFKNTDVLAAAQRRNKELTMEDYEFIRQRIVITDKFGVRVAPANREVKNERETLEAVPIIGTSANMTDLEKTEIADGRYFTDNENEEASRVAFLGADVAEKLFPTGTVLGQEISIAGIPFRVIGVAAAKGSVFGRSQDNYVAIPIKTYSRVIGPLVRGRWLSFVGTARNDKQFDEAVEEVRQIMRLRRRLNGNETDNFAIITPDAIMGARDRIFGPIFIVAIAVPGIALVVGGIVIMNIMLVSVTERTKEIGIRKALGARRADVLKQFLVEAVTLSAIGGAIGVILAWLIGMLVTKFFLQTYLSWGAVIIAVSVSGIVGILSGLLPAWKAARLDPIEALRAD
jgi:putative ABC transport system permease protein